MSLDDLFSGDDDRAAAAAEQATENDLPAVESALAGPDPDARWWAAAALRHLPSERATYLLLATADSPDADLRAVTIHALGLRQSPAAIPFLLKGLDDPSEYLARLAADALIQTGRPAVPGLIETLERSPHPRVRANAARALALIADPDAIPALFRALEDESPLVGHWADQGLDRMGVGQIYFRV